jgi:hypothetical protein
MTSAMSLARVLLAMVAVLLLFAPIAGADGHRHVSRLDAEDLIGEWWGMWKNREASGRWDLTIHSLERDKVRGKVATTGPAREGHPNYSYSFEGTIKGNVIRGELPDGRGSVEIKIQGSAITGSIATREFWRTDLEATKKKGSSWK